LDKTCRTKTTRWHGSAQNHARHKMDAENKLENEWDKAPYLELGALKLYVTHQPIKFY